jgi:crotonobetainyl-CoA:carnitine CoA-transferase CaiB-like acyl-CoA transferase
MAQGPLSGIRILDFSQVIAGPFGCMALADMGAEVIKVEPPGGEQWRIAGQFMPGESKSFQALNRGKRSLVLKLDDPRAQAIVHRMIPGVDVVVVNFRPDVPARLGVDYATLAKLRPDLIYVSSTAFGERGPWALKPGYDIVAQAVTGLMVNDAKLDESGTPLPMSPPIGDFATGLAIAGAVCAALYHRACTGEGQRVETSLLATALALQGGAVMENPAADARRNELREERRKRQQQGVRFDELVRMRRPSRGGLFYRVYLTLDGAIALGALSSALRAKVRSALGIEFRAMDDPGWDPEDPRQVARAHEAAEQAVQTLATKTTAEWLEIFEREGVPAGPVHFPEDLSEHPQVRANGLMVDLVHERSGPQRAVGPFARFSGFEDAPVLPSPALGAHTDACLRELGYSDAQIAALREAGVVV